DLSPDTKPITWHPPRPPTTPRRASRRTSTSSSTGSTRIPPTTTPAHGGCRRTASPTNGLRWVKTVCSRWGKTVCSIACQAWRARRISASLATTSGISTRHAGARTTVGNPLTNPLTRPRPPTPTSTRWRKQRPRVRTSGARLITSSAPTRTPSCFSSSRSTPRRQTTLRTRLACE
ncbi:hypothetical protein T484DRAFT_1886633, partial [Baffinella frigidus]